MSARIDTAAERARLDALLRNARRDECLDRMVTIDLRQIIGRSIRMLDEIDRLTAALAEADDRGAAQMRERAAEAMLYLGRMKAMDAPEAEHLIRALPLREPGAYSSKGNEK